MSLQKYARFPVDTTMTTKFNVTLRIKSLIEELKGWGKVVN